MMSWFSITIIAVTFLSGLANMALAVYVYRKNPRERINKNFFYFGFAIFLWCLTKFISMLYKNLFWLEINYSSGSILELAGIYFSYALIDKKINKWVGVLLYVICAGFIATTISTNLFIKNLISFSDLGFKVDYGPLFYVWAIYTFLIVSVIVYVPFSFIKKADERRKKQIAYFLTGEAILGFWILIISIILPFLGFTQFTALDTPATLFLVGFTSYSIIKYHLMDISSLLFQAFVYALVIIVIISLLLLLMFAGSFLFAHFMIWPLYIIAVAVAIVLFFIGRLFFIEKRDLEKAKINLTDLLAKSEENRKRAETERDKTTTIISSFTDGLIILDENNDIFSINPEAEKILGLDKNKLLGKSFQTMAEYSKAEPIVSVIIPGIRNIHRREVEVNKKLIVEFSVISLTLNKSDIGHLLVIHDVTREKIVERMKTEFVSLAAHQLRTPLSIVKWSMSMLKKGDFGKLNKKQGEIVKNTFRNNERLISLVNDLLNITRIEEGRYLYEMAMTDIREIIKSVMENYKEEIKAKKIIIDFKKPEDFPLMMIDTEKIKLVVQNFIDNAINYSQPGGKVIISLKNDDKNIEFKVQDFGIGIPEEEQSKIFGKFSRAGNAAKMNTTGSGLGLFLSKNIIEAHGGEIWFESEEGKGASFYFSLPIKKEGV